MSIDPRIAARRRNVSETRARSTLGRGLGIAMALALIGLGAWVVLRSGLFSLDHIEVVGARRVSVEAALELEGIELGQPLATVRTGSLAAAIALDPWVKHVSVVQEWPHQLTIVIEERVPAAVLEAPEGWFLLAADGVVLEPREQRDEALPTVVWGSGPESVAEDPKALTALEFGENLTEALRPGAVVYQGEEGLEATVGGFRVRLGGASEGEEKALAVAAVLARSPQPGSVISVVAPSRPAVMAPGDGDG